MDSHIRCLNYSSMNSLAIIKPATAKMFSLFINWNLFCIANPNELPFSLPFQAPSIAHLWISFPPKHTILLNWQPVNVSKAPNWLLLMQP